MVLSVKSQDVLILLCICYKYKERNKNHMQVAVSVEAYNIVNFWFLIFFFLIVYYLTWNLHYITLIMWQTGKILNIKNIL